MTNRATRGLNHAKKFLLAAVGVAALVGPVAIGVLISVGPVPAIRAQSPVVITPIVQTVAPSVAQIAQAVPAPPVNPAPAAAAAPPLSAPVTTPQGARLMVMYFDFDSMLSDERFRARLAGIDYLHKYVTPSDRVAIMAHTGGEPTVVTDFTSDTAVMEAAIRSLSTGVGDGSNSVSDVDARLHAVGQVAKMLMKFSEKKELIYFSSGVNRAGTENKSELEATINLAEKANMVIYPVDTRALLPELRETK